MATSAAWLFFISLLVLAITPGIGAIVVVNATIRYGWRSAVVTIFGIVSADYIFVLAAFFGIHLLLSSFGFLFHIIQWFGVGYLAFLGVQMLWKRQPNAEPAASKTTQDGSYIGQYLLGLFVTLGNPKAIIYYSSIMPALLGTNGFSLSQLLLVLLLVTLAIVSTMTLYACLAHITHTAGLSNNKARAIQIVAGVALVVTALLLGLHILHTPT